MDDCIEYPLDPGATFTPAPPVGELPARYRSAFSMWFKGRKPDGSLILPTPEEVKKAPERHLENLRAHLQGALQVELFTLPPYLTALLSIPDGQANLWPAQVMRSVIMEEMLHMTLVANLLNAVGGQVVLDEGCILQRYPSRIPFSGLAFDVELQPLSSEGINTLRKVEVPEQLAPKNPPKDYDLGFTSLSEYYFVVESMLHTLSEALGEGAVFSGERARQFPASSYYGGGGRVVEVHDLASAMRAINEISLQGEGGRPGDPKRTEERPVSVFVDDRREGEVYTPTHFFRFDELLRGRRYVWGDRPGAPTGAPLSIDFEAIYPMLPNPHQSDFADWPEIARALARFNGTFTGLLLQLHGAFAGHHDRFKHAVALMYELKYQGQALMRTPNPRVPGCTVGTPFEWNAEAVIEKP